MLKALTSPLSKLRHTQMSEEQQESNENSLNVVYHDGRSETRAILDGAEMSEEYSRKLAKGAFGLAAWLEQRA